MPNPASAVVNGQVGLFFSRQQAAAAGAYFVAQNVTPGTALQTGTATSFSATANGLVTVTNNNPLTSGINVYMDYIKLMMSGTAPTATTVMHFNMIRDAVAGVTPSAGSVALVTTNVNGGSASTASNVAINVPTGAPATGMTIPAATSAAVNMGRASIPTSLGITGDIYVLNFGGNFVDDGGQGGGTAVRATAAARLSDSTVPAILAPGQGLVVNMWWLTQATTKPSFEYEIGFMVY